jgi:hypothetical protein
MKLQHWTIQSENSADCSKSLLLQSNSHFEVNISQKFLVQGTRNKKRHAALKPTKLTNTLHRVREIRKVMSYVTYNYFNIRSCNYTVKHSNES